MTDADIIYNTMILTALNLGVNIEILGYQKQILAYNEENSRNGAVSIQILREILHELRGEKNE